MQHSVLKKKSSIAKEAALTLALVLGAMLLIKTFIIGISAVEGTSMENSVKNGDIVVSLKSPILNIYRAADKKSFNKFIRDRVIILDINGVSCIKRCVGVSGDTLLIWNSDFRPDTFIIEEKGIFVLGDNFRNSLDSRSAGQIDISALHGMMLFRIPAGSKSSSGRND